MCSGWTPSPSTVAPTSTMAPSLTSGMNPWFGTFTAMIRVGSPDHIAAMIGTTSSWLWPMACSGSGTLVVAAHVASRSPLRLTGSWKSSGTGCQSATSRAKSTYSPMWLSTEHGTRP